MTAKDLKERWRSTEGSALAKEALAFLLGDGPQPAGVSNVDGRLDLRGFSISQPTVGRTVGIAAGGRVVELDGTLEIRDSHWNQIDLSYASLRGLRFFNTTITDCVFDSADCTDWRLWTSTVSDSSFVGSDLTDTALATWWDGRRNLWKGVNFDTAKMTKLRLHGGVFDACTFRNTKLDGTEFRLTSLRRCVFAGQLSDVMFFGRDVDGEPPSTPLIDVDFSESIFDYVDFIGCRFERVTVPDRVLVIPRFAAVAAVVDSELAEQTSREARRIKLITEGAAGARADAVGVIDLRGLAAWGGEDFATSVRDRFLKATREVS